MTKVTILRLDSVTNNDTTATSSINTNFQAIQEAMENTLSRDGTTPNFMDSDLDMNSYRIINAGDPENDTDVITKGWFDQYVEDAAGASATAVAAADRAEGSAHTAQTAAAQASIAAGQIEDNVRLSRDWATKMDGTVDGVDYSSKYYASQIIPIATDITTVSGIASDVTTVSGIASDVTAVADNDTDISAVAADLTNIDAVAADLTNIDTVAGIAADISTVSGIASDVSDVADNATDISTVATDIANINAVAADLTNIDNASQYAAEAKQWAIGDPSEPVDGSAKYWAQQAAGQVIPSQTGHSGEYLTTDGTALSWDTVDALPSQVGQSGKYLTTDGTTASWGTIQQAPSTDNITISLNTSDELQTIGVINQNDTTTALKSWSGTKAEYDAIVTKDANTLYNVTDDSQSSSDIYSKTEVDSLLDTKANVTLSNMNPTQTVKNTIVGWGMPDYTQGVDISSYTSANQYTAPCDGIVYADYLTGNNGGIYVNNVLITGGNGTSGTSISGTVIVPKNSTVYVLYPDSRYAGCHFYPMKGANQ